MAARSRSADLATGPGRTVALRRGAADDGHRPVSAGGSGSAYIRLEYRRAMEIAIVGAAAAVSIGADGRISAARVALTAVAPTIVRAPDAEAALIGAAAESATYRLAGEAAGGRRPPDRRCPGQRRLSPGDARRRGGSDGRCGCGPGRRPRDPGPGVALGPRAGGLTMGLPLQLIVDGQPLSAVVEPGRTLLRVLRDDLGRTGTKEGCDDSECGACMVLIDGRPVNSCSYLALQAAGRAITTVEGLAGPGDDLHPLQRAFLEGGGIQCGFCTPGMLIAAAALLASDPDPVRRNDPRRPRRQPLPLHRLPADRPRRPARGRPSCAASRTHSTCRHRSARLARPQPDWPARAPLLESVASAE